MSGLQIKLLTINSFLVLAASFLGAEAILNCSHHRARYSRFFDQQSHQRNQSVGAKRWGSRPFIEPILHECLNAHRYDTTQLPLRVGFAPHPIEITYYFFLNNLISLDESGSLSLKAFLKVRVKIIGTLLYIYFECYLQVQKLQYIH